MRRRRERGPESTEELTLGDALRFEEAGSWPGLTRWQFWTFDARVPEEFRGDGPYGPRQVLTLDGDDLLRWKSARRAWEARRLDWLRAAAEEGGR